VDAEDLNARRFLTELLLQMDGLLSAATAPAPAPPMDSRSATAAGEQAASAVHRVLVIAATNRIGDIDPALVSVNNVLSGHLFGASCDNNTLGRVGLQLRRFVSRVEVPLPSDRDRLVHLARLLDKTDVRAAVVSATLSTPSTIFHCSTL
jgi:SpoVK/Ycf46/Vps4 family AAA+-type ATPase